MPCSTSEKRTSPGSSTPPCRLLLPRVTVTEEEHGWCLTPLMHCRCGPAKAGSNPVSFLGPVGAGSCPVWLQRQIDEACHVCSQDHCTERSRRQDTPPSKSRAFGVSDNVSVCVLQTGTKLLSGWCPGDFYHHGHDQLAGKASFVWRSPVSP